MAGPNDALACLTFSYCYKQQTQWHVSLAFQISTFDSTLWKVDAISLTLALLTSVVSTGMKSTSEETYETYLAEHSSSVLDIDLLNSTPIQYGLLW